MRFGISEAAAKAGRSVEDVTTERVGLIPAKRFAEPREIGETCAFLCGEQAGYITGQNIVVDGALFNSVF